MSEGLRSATESGPDIPPRDLDALTQIIHDTRVELGGSERFKDAFARPVLKKHLEPRQYYRIRNRIMASVIKKLQDRADAEGRTLERFRYSKSGGPILPTSPYAYTAASQEEIIRTTIALLSAPPSKLDRHPDGFLEAWTERALQKMREVS